MERAGNKKYESRRLCVYSSRVLADFLRVEPFFLDGTPEITHFRLLRGCGVSFKTGWLGTILGMSTLSSCFTLKLSYRARLFVYLSLSVWFMF